MLTLRNFLIKKPHSATYRKKHEQYSANAIHDSDQSTSLKRVLKQPDKVHKPNAAIYEHVIENIRSFKKKLGHENSNQTVINRLVNRGTQKDQL